MDGSKKRRKYSAADMAKAIAAAKKGMPISTASKEFKVPRVTLRNKMKGISPEVCTIGPSTILTDQEESRLVQWILDIAQVGFPVTRVALIDTVAKLVSELKRDNPFTDGRPGKKWFKSLFRRHPELRMRTAEKLAGHRSVLTEPQIRSWFADVLNYLSQNNYEDIVKDGQRVFNADETAFALCPKTGKVIGQRGGKNVYDVSKASDKDNVTALFTVSGSGELAPPMMVYAYQRIPADIVTKFPKNWAIGKSETGWMTGETFFEFMANVFDPWLEKQGILRPVLFFVDGHKSHLTMHLSNFLREKEIILVALFPNATHILQPLDVAVFHPLKLRWKEAVRKWLVDHNDEGVTKHNIAPILCQVVEETVSPVIIKNGFRVCGLYPFNPDNVDYSKCIETKRPNETLNSTTISQDNVGLFKNANQHHLDFFENQIPAELLSKFVDHAPSEEWSGRATAQELFHVWRQMKQLATVLTEEIVSDSVDPAAPGSIPEIPNATPPQVEHESFGPTVTSTPSVSTDSASNRPTSDLPTLNQNTEPSQLLCSPARSNHSPMSEITHRMEVTISGKTVQQDLVPSRAEAHDVSDHTLPGPSTSSIQESPFKRVLFWPEHRETKRKSKDKIPAVATSNEWKLYYENKAQKAAEKEKEKQQRKAARLEKANQKELSKAAKGRGRGRGRGRGGRGGRKKGGQTRTEATVEDMSDWECYKCNLAWREQSRLERRSRWITCDNCKKHAHRVCVPRQHLEKLGMSISDSEDEAAFLCTECGNFHSSDDAKLSDAESSSSDAF